MACGGLGSGPRGPELIRLPVSGFVFQDYGDPTIKTVADIIQGRRDDAGGVFVLPAAPAQVYGLTEPNRRSHRHGFFI